MVVLIGLVGYARSGKDTFAHVLEKQHGFVRLAFADQIREIAYLLGYQLYLGSDKNGDEYDGETYTEAIDRAGYEEVKRLYPEARQWLVKIGHGFRQVFGDSFWLNQVVNQIEDFDGDQGIVVSDCRYLNEAHEIKRLGGILVYIERPGCGPANETEEASVAEILNEANLVSHVISNEGTLREFKQRVYEWSLNVSSSPSPAAVPDA